MSAGLGEDLELARRLGELAGRSPLTEADVAVERAILDVLAHQRPDDAVLSEEIGMAGRPGSKRRWLIDPIDGTSYFVEGDPAWGTHIALEIEGRIDAVLSEAGFEWDHAPGVILIRGAGGRFTDPEGGQRVDLRGGLYTNGHLHTALLATRPN